MSVLLQLQQMRRFYGMNEETTEAFFFLDHSTQIQYKEQKGSEDEDRSVETAFKDYYSNNNPFRFNYYD